MIDDAIGGNFRGRAEFVFHDLQFGVHSFRIYGYSRGAKTKSRSIHDLTYVVCLYAPIRFYLSSKNLGPTRGTRRLPLEQNKELKQSRN